MTSNSTISMGSGEGTTRRYPRAASSTICQPSTALAIFRLGSRIKRPNRLGGMLHGRIVARHDRLRHQADDRRCSPAAANSSCKRLYEQVADFALTRCAANIERLARAPGPTRARNAAIALRLAVRSRA